MIPPVLNQRTQVLLLLCFMWYESTNHKVIGVAYTVAAVVLGVLGFAVSVVFRFEISTIGVWCLYGDYQFYNVAITAHGLIMVFGFIMPIILGGAVNYTMPLVLGTPDMLFPRLNNLSLWAFFGAATVLTLAVLVDEGPGLGWTLYATLSCFEYHSSVGVDLVVLTVMFLGVSSLANGLNATGTIYACRLVTTTMLDAPLWALGIIITNFCLIAALPTLAVAVVLLLVDRNFNSCFYDALGGGDVLLFEHLFWFFGHPEVYIIILPIFALISWSLEQLIGHAVFGYVSMLYSTTSIGVLGFLVWAHHMYVASMDIDSRSYFSAATLLIAVPTSIKIFNWLLSTCFSSFTIWCADVTIIYGFVLLFAGGGLTGVLLSNAGLDVFLHDTYFVVGHFHYVLSLAAVFGAVCFTHIYGGRLVFLDAWDFWGSLMALTSSTSAGLAFLSMHVAGLCGMPRRYSDFADCYLIWAPVWNWAMITLLLWWILWSIGWVAQFASACSFSCQRVGAIPMGVHVCASSGTFAESLVMLYHTEIDAMIVPICVSHGRTMLV